VARAIRLGSYTSPHHRERLPSRSCLGTTAIHCWETSSMHRSGMATIPRGSRDPGVSNAGNRGPNSRNRRGPSQRLACGRPRGAVARHVIPVAVVARSLQPGSSGLPALARAVEAFAASCARVWSRSEFH